MNLKGIGAWALLLPLGFVQQNVMWVSAGNPIVVVCCNTANSSLMIDEKFEILNKRIGSVSRAFGKSEVLRKPTLHMAKPLMPITSR